MKIKLKAPAPVEAAAKGSSQAQPATPSSAPKLALKFKKASHPAGEAADSQPSEAPKQKRKYTKKSKADDGTQAAPKPKKRPLDDGDEGFPAKRKSKPTFKSLAQQDSEDDDDDDTQEAIAVAPRPPRQPPVRTHSVKISLKTKGSTTKSGGIPIIKMKGAGKPPLRPPGVGYDSEADEAENDPAIEAQFVLRLPENMKNDGDLLRKAIEDKTIGKKPSEGGPGVQFRFLDREGRRAMVTIQGRMYAATMVELPCVIESLKSWNKKDWVKTADICQMLLVLGPVKSEEEAKKFTRPPIVEPNSHRYPHGLTPPMQWVRKQRFRPRKSYLDVERIETHTEKLLNADEIADDTKYDLIDSEAETSDDDQSAMDEDAEGEDEDMADAFDYAETPAEERMDADALEQMLAAGLMEEEDVQVEIEDGEGNTGDMDDLFGGEDTVLDIETPITSHDVALQALTQNPNVVIEPESPASTPAGATSPDDDDDDDEDDDDDGDPEAAAKQQLIEQTKAEIRELEQAIATNEQQRDSHTNILFKKRLQGRIDQQIMDLKVKKTQIGETGE